MTFVVQRFALDDEVMDSIPGVTNLESNLSKLVLVVKFGSGIHNTGNCLSSKRSLLRSNLQYAMDVL